MWESPLLPESETYTHTYTISLSLANLVSYERRLDITMSNRFARTKALWIRGNSIKQVFHAYYLESIIIVTIRDVKEKIESQKLTV